MSRMPQVRPAQSSACRNFGSFRGVLRCSAEFWLPRKDAACSPLLSWRVLWRNFCVARSDGLDVGGDGGVSSAGGPADSTSEHVEHEFVAPVLRAVAHGSAENA